MVASFLEVVGMGDRGRRIQTSSYNMNKFWGPNVQHDDYS